MNDPTEQMLRRGLAELVRDKPTLGPIDLEAVTRSGQGRRSVDPGRTHASTTRWLAAVAALVLVAGVGLAGWFGLSQGERVSTAEPQQGPGQLTGVRWLATQINDRPARPEAAGDVPYLILGSDQRVDGGDPCNKVFGSYRLDGAHLRFHLGVTQMYCGSSDRGQQSAYLSALGATTTVRRDGPILTLLDSTGAVVLVFRPAAADEPSPVSSKILIRVRNDTAVRFAKVSTVFPDGADIQYGSVAAGQDSAYQPVREAYSRPFVSIVVADGRELTFQPIDSVGETPLTPGRYTYMLSIEGSGSGAAVNVRLEADQ